MDSIRGNLVIVGAAGYWGTILVRAAVEVFGVDHVVALDISRPGLKLMVERLKAQNIISDGYTLDCSTDLDEVLSDVDNRYFVIATPPQLHYQNSMKVLSHKRNIMIAKPVALSAEDAREIGAFAASQGVVATVDHTIMFHPAVSALVSEVKAGAIGDPKTFYAEWLSRGKIQDGVDVIWDLAPHPLSILLEFWELPIDVSCSVLDAIDGVPTEASLFLTEKSTGKSATIHVSWMDSDKSRTFKIRGSHHTIIFDDTREIGSKLRVKGGKTSGHPLLSEGYKEPIYELDYLRQKSITFTWEEPLKKELRTFIKMAEQPSTADAKLLINEINKGIVCVKLIEAAHSSINKHRSHDNS